MLSHRTGTGCRDFHHILSGKPRTRPPQVQKGINKFVTLSRKKQRSRKKLRVTGGERGGVSCWWEHVRQRKGFLSFTFKTAVAPWSQSAALTTLWPSLHMPVFSFPEYSQLLSSVPWQLDRSVLLLLTTPKPKCRLRISSWSLRKFLRLTATAPKAWSRWVCPFGGWSSPNFSMKRCKEEV